MTTRKVRISDLSAGPLNDHLKDWLTKYANRNRREPSDSTRPLTS